MRCLPEWKQGKRSKRLSRCLIDISLREGGNGGIFKVKWKTGKRQIKMDLSAGRKIKRESITL